MTPSTRRSLARLAEIAVMSGDVESLEKIIGQLELARKLKAARERNNQKGLRS